MVEQLKEDPQAIYRYTELLQVNEIANNRHSREFSQNVFSPFPIVPLSITIAVKALHVSQMLFFFF